jgi:hypothetical protein
LVLKVSIPIILIAITQRRETGYQYRYGQWNLNNGNGTYTTYNPSYSFNVQTSGEYKANLFVKLRPSSNVKDFIVCRDNGLEVHWNQSGEIGDIYQNFTNNGNPWLFFETVFLILRIFLKIFWSVIILSISMSF